MIDPQQNWIDTINKIAPSKVADEGLKKLVDAVSAAVSSKAQLQGITGQMTFTFQKAIMFAQLKAIVASPDPNVGAMQFAQAWGAAITASTMVVAPGAIFGTPSPSTTWSAVAATLLDPPSLVIAQQMLQADLLKMAAKPTTKPEDGDMGPALRRAFLALTYTIAGLDSTAPTPIPLLVPALPLQ